MQSKLPLPQMVTEAYPLLTGDTVKYIGRFAPKVPISPDHIYDVYRDVDSDILLTHVTTDYPDPIHDSEELRDISEGYSFKDIVAPNSKKDDNIQMVDNDDFNEEFFVREGNIYHYVANTQYNPHKAH